ncbi:hypothetical protein SEVIR_2G101600v4 [Setaria viridis]|uniref:Uncharacterized protein n=1 Tax=Setaria viridis TaxID=4556 RepID=A0A4V6DAX1_SETVI|nr:hypothetical protein SEVIR_2G101600v2 [Setaria viridis]
MPLALLSSARSSCTAAATRPLLSSARSPCAAAARPPSSPRSPCATADAGVGLRIDHSAHRRRVRRGGQLATTAARPPPLALRRRRSPSSSRPAPPPLALLLESIHRSHGVVPLLGAATTSSFSSAPPRRGCRGPPLPITAEPRAGDGIAVLEVAADAAATPGRRPRSPRSVGSRGFSRSHPWLEESWRRWTWCTRLLAMAPPLHSGGGGRCGSSTMWRNFWPG